MMYYILSIKNSKKDEIYLTWWRPDQGYTFYLKAAGKYTIEVIAASPKYYNNGVTTLAVPCEFIDSICIDPKPDWGEYCKKEGKVVTRGRLKKLISKYKKGAL